MKATPIGGRWAWTMRQPVLRVGRERETLLDQGAGGRAGRTAEPRQDRAPPSAGRWRPPAAVVPRTWNVSTVTPGPKNEGRMARTPDADRDVGWDRCVGRVATRGRGVARGARVGRGVGGGVASARSRDRQTANDASPDAASAHRSSSTSSGSRPPSRPGWSRTARSQSSTFAQVCTDRSRARAQGSRSPGRR